MEICKLLSDNMEERNPQDLFGYTPFTHAFANGHLDVCRFFSDDVSEKTNNPVLIFFYLFNLLFLFILHPKYCLNIGRFWPAYFVAICLVWLVPFIVPFYVYYIRYSMVSVFFLCPTILASLNGLIHFFLFTFMFHLYFKKYRNIYFIG